jgi:hypothetical protein
MLSFYDWKYQIAYTVPGLLESQEGTMEEAMLVFFYDGVCPWIRDIGYKWSREDHVIAKKFLHLCYMIDTTSKMYDMDLETPEPRHRNFQEDRETFDYFVDTTEFIDFLANWEFRSEIVGTRFDYLIKEFCYCWVDVCSGKPGAFTQRIFDADAELEAEDEQLYAGPDMSSRKKWDLY